MDGRVHDEWIRNVLKKDSALSAERLTRTRTLMNLAVRDCLVVGYEEIIDSLVLPDVEDRHVLAAAIHAKADVIITFNLRDFPPDALFKYSVEAVHPDEFLMSLLDFAPELVCETVKRQQNALKNPPKSVAELLGTLDGLGLTQTAAKLRMFINLPGAAN